MSARLALALAFVLGAVSAVLALAGWLAAGMAKGMDL